VNRKRQLSQGIPLSLLAVLFISACTMWGDLRPVEGWPELKVTEHHVPHAVMRDRCTPYVPAGFSPEACSLFYLKERQCHIFYSADFPPSDAIKAHEQRRCKGYGSKDEREYLSRLMGAM
jgi:hypothetical protein